jgi:hypothetical protein
LPASQPPKGKGKAAAPVPAAVKKPAAAAAAKSSNPLLEEKRPKNFGARRGALARRLGGVCSLGVQSQGSAARCRPRRR